MSRVRFSVRPRIFYTLKTSKTSGKLGRQRQCLFQWPATGIVASRAGRHGWATYSSNGDNLYGGDGGVCVRTRVHACVRDVGRACVRALVGRGGRVGRAQVSKSRGPGFNPTDAVSNLGQVRLPHVALV